MNHLWPVRHARLFSSEFCQRTLDALLSHIAILAEDGTIVAVNAAWNNFAKANELDHRHWVRRELSSSLPPGNRGVRQEAPTMAAGIAHVICQVTSDFYLEYPCHSPTERRWFSVRATRFEERGKLYVVVAHDNITQRVAAEMRVIETNRLLELQATTDATDRNRQPPILR